MEQYEILEQIGKGAFGSALLVRHKIEKKNRYSFQVCPEENPTGSSDRQNTPFCSSGGQWVAMSALSLGIVKEVTCDFGLAKLLSSDDLASSVVGTPSYMCPELLADIPYGSKSDIWSLGCCIYEMAALRPAFKAFDMQALINKINKSIVSPLPTLYSGGFRSLVKSMLRKNPELRPSAAELLKHPHLQPYVLRINLKYDNPRRNTFPISHSDYPMKTRFSEADEVSKLIDRGERRSSYGNDRTQVPSISEAELDSPFTVSKQEFSSYVTQKFEEMSIGSVHKEICVYKPVTKVSTVSKTPRLSTPAKGSAFRRLSTPSKIPSITSNHGPLPMSHTPTTISSRATRRASLPLSVSSTKTVNHEPRYTSNVGFTHSIESSDVSVNAPHIDKIAEFPLASSDEPLCSVHRASSTSAQCCSTSPNIAGQSIMKDRCTVEIVDRALGKPNAVNKSSQHNQIGGISSQSSSDSHQRRFDTSSYQQRAEALEGLLEFSARLLQQERYDELNVLLKPFGPEKVSPRETAIWLAKSFKETGA
ncbi:hypothetical protein Cgig2_016958 [Carnegiea gigantea]|uniref:Protein kinase domain-containing protein n=1 Tax=Carnegiea gigantea TaxID=171969 RepID=A0A9Q1QKI6_9CARY|nr:hypothetical protein Cgig2_016958 [Carnegiea gigantea]